MARSPGEGGSKVSTNGNINDVFVFSAGQMDTNIFSSIESSPSSVITTSTARGHRSTPSVSISPPPPLVGARTADNERSMTESLSILSRFQNMQLLLSQSPSHELSPPSLKSPLNLDDINNALQTIENYRETRIQLLQPETPLTTPHRSPRRRSSPRLGQECHRVEDEEPPSDIYHTAAFQRGLTQAKELMSDLSNVLASSSIHLEPDSAMKSLYDRARKLRSFEPQTMRKVGFVGDSGVGESP